MVLFIYACLELRIELNTPWEVNKCHKRVGRGRKARRGGRKGRTVREQIVTGDHCFQYSLHPSIYLSGKL